MECRYCQAVNAEDDHRCSRCGRRLRMTPLYTGMSAAAPALKFERTAPAPVAAEPLAAPAPRKAITYQPSLFGSRELPRVVPFASIAPETVAAPKEAVPSKPRIRRPKIIPGQQKLEFSPSAVPRRTKLPDGVIYCGAPVAIPAHRAVAAALDGSVILIALGIFGSIFYFAGGHMVLNAKTIPLLIGVVAGVVLFYKLLWCLGNGDTAGMKWSRLTLVNFDGRPPNRKQRFYRLFSGFLSLMAAGIGLLWALVDEETLTWHDHISKTFPTPY